MRRLVQAAISAKLEREDEDVEGEGRYVEVFPLNSPTQSRPPFPAISL